jgi:hypothetical protein
MAGGGRAALRPGRGGWGRGGTTRVEAAGAAMRSWTRRLGRRRVREARGARLACVEARPAAVG